MGRTKIKGSKEDSQNQLWSPMVEGGEPIVKISYGHLWLREETMLEGGGPIVKISYGHLWLREETMLEGGEPLS